MYILSAEFPLVDLVHNVWAGRTDSTEVLTLHPSCWCCQWWYSFCLQPRQEHVGPQFNLGLVPSYKYNTKNLWVTAAVNHLKLEHGFINFPHKKRGLKIQNGTKTLQMNQPAPQPKMIMLWVVTVHSLCLTSSSVDMIHWAFSPGKSYFSTKRPELKCHSSFMSDQKKGWFQWLKQWNITSTVSRI